MSSPARTMGSALRWIKIVHTIVWAFFVAAILAIPVAASRGAFQAVLLLISLVMLEVVVLAVNGMRCPLTGVAARYTADRQANFDIYLPLWLATWNKQVFGGLFVLGLLIALREWLRR